MYCKKCGTKLEKGMMFCPKCGTKGEGEKLQVSKLQTNKKRRNILVQVACIGAVVVAVGVLIIILGVGWIAKRYIANKNLTHDTNEDSMENYNVVSAPVENDYDYGTSTADCSEDLYNVQGNTNGNAGMGGNVAAQGGWVYWTAKGNIFKQNVSAGGDIEWVYSFENKDTRKLNISGEWIYLYSGWDKGKILRIETDGSYYETLLQYNERDEMVRYGMSDYAFSDDNIYLPKYTQVSGSKYSVSLVSINVNTQEEDDIFLMGECRISEIGKEKWKFLGIENGFLYFKTIQDMVIEYAKIDIQDKNNITYLSGGEEGEFESKEVVCGDKIYQYTRFSIKCIDTISGKEIGEKDYGESGYSIFAPGTGSLLNEGPFSEGITCSIGENGNTYGYIGTCYAANDDDIFNLELWKITEDQPISIYTIGDGYIYYFMNDMAPNNLQLYRVYYDGSEWEKLPLTIEDWNRPYESSANDHQEDQEDHLINEGDSVVGNVEREVYVEDEELGGMSSQYYVLKFDQDRSFFMEDENGTWSSTMAYSQVPIYSDEVNVEDYLGKRIRCDIYPVETYTRMGLMAELKNVVLEGE